MNRSDSIAALAAALAKAQARIAPAVKDKINPAFRSHYATLEAIVEACREPLAANGLSIIQMPTDDPANCERTALTTMLLHSSGEYISQTVSVRLTKQDSQGLGSALTYLRRYALAAFVGVTATEDDDGNAASQPQPSQQAVSPKSFVRAPQQAVSATTMSDDKVFEGVLAYVKSEDGVSAKGRAYTKTKVCWTNDGNEKVWATTFSPDEGALANRAKSQNIPVRIKYRVGDRGTDIVSLDVVEPAGLPSDTFGGPDAIPF
jgi:hypothetical protein